MATDHFISLLGNITLAFLPLVVLFYYIQTTWTYWITWQFVVPLEASTVRMVRTRWAFCMALYAGALWPSACGSLIYLPTNTLVPAPLCTCAPHKCNAEDLTKLSFWKPYIIFSLSIVYCDLGWGRVNFLEKVKALVKASWKDFMIEMQAEKESQKTKVTL